MVRDLTRTETSPPPHAITRPDGPLSLPSLVPVTQANTFYINNACKQIATKYVRYSFDYPLQDHTLQLLFLLHRIITHY